MRLEATKYLFDIREACDLLTQFTAGKTFSDYVSDPLLRSAVERQCEIVAEALSQAIRLDASLASKITDSKRIVAFRNMLIHGYASVAAEVVWTVLQTDLPKLTQEVTELLTE